MKKSVCKFCSCNFIYGNSSKGFFCSRGYQQKWQHKNVEIPKWRAGKTRCTISMKKRLREDRGYECEICGIDDWEDKSISLEVDHIDGVRSNNSPSNLRLLCPNCHSQTPTFRGANVKNLRLLRLLDSSIGRTIPS